VVSTYLTLRRAAHASPVAIGVLLAANAIPLVGVLLLGWDLATLVAVYWAENGVVGLYAVARILTAGTVFRWIDRDVVPQPPPPPRRGVAAGALPRLPVIAVAGFFCVHYGLFWVVHGIFVWTVLPLVFSGFGSPGDVAGFGTFGTFGDVGTFGLQAAFPDARVVVTASVFMLISHGVSFVANWLLGGEHRTSTPQAETSAPYARVIVLHLTILLGAFGVVLFGASISALVVMVGLKTAVDLGAHLAERRRAAARTAERVRPMPPDALDAAEPVRPG
jgi:hypothetical protein